MKFSVCKILFGSIELRQFFSRARELGFQGVEFGYRDALESGRFSDPFALRDELNRFGLTWSANYWGDNWHHREERERLLQQAEKIGEFLSKAGCENVVIGPPVRFPGYDEKKREYLRTACDAMNQVARILRDRGLKCSIHNHYGTIIEGEDEIEFALANVDADLLGFCPDTAHLAVSGIEPVRFIERYAQRVAHVHLKDAIKPGEFVPREENWVSRLRDLGQGEIPLAQLVAILVNHSYAGWFSYEQDVPQAGETPMESARKSKQYIDSVLSKVA